MASNSAGAIESKVWLRLETTASAKSEKGAPVAAARRLLHQGRLQLRLELLLQPPLEVGIGAEAEPGDEAQDRGRRDARPCRELRDSLEAGERIVRKQDMCGPPLRRA